MSIQWRNHWQPMSNDTSFTPPIYIHVYTIYIHVYNACTLYIHCTYIVQCILYYMQPNHIYHSALLILCLYRRFCYNIHCTSYSVHYTVYSVHCTVYTVQCTMYTVHCSMNTTGRTMYAAYCTSYSVQCTAYSVQCTV